jgi:iron complex outermembrane receptor protein
MRSAARSHLLLRLCAAWALACYCATSSVAEESGVTQLADMPLDALLDVQVSGASKFAMRMSETAASVTVISAAEMRALGYGTLADVLASLRGVMIANDRTYSYIGVRGFFAAGDYNTRVLLLVDGNRVNDALYDQAYLGSEFPLDLSLVERVEFIPGQGSAVFGANALFGVINVITRRAAAAEPSSAGVTLGSGGLRELRASTRAAVGSGALLVAASRSVSRGEDLLDPQQGLTQGTDYERRSALYARYEQGSWTSSLTYADRLKGTPFYPGLIFNDPRSRYRDTYALFDTSTQMRLGAHSEFAGRVFVGDYRFVGDYAVDYPPPTLNRDIGRGRWWGAEARVFSTANARHKLVAGVELQRAGELAQRNFDVDPPSADYLDDRRSATRIGLFAEDQWTLSPRSTLTLGARADRTYGSGTQLSPRIALNHRPNDELVLKLITGSAFRPPNAYEAYYAVPGPGGSLANPSLASERVRGHELALEWRPRASTRVAASLFDSRASRLLVLGYDAATELFQYHNLGTLHMHGAELELEQLWAGGGRVRANVTLQRTHADAALGQTGQFPQRMAKLAAIQPLDGHWTLGIEAQALSRRGSAPGQGLLHATLATLPSQRGWAFSLAVKNVLDARVFDPGLDAQAMPVIPQPGRQWVLSLERLL